jgi:hypothetical protein
VTANAFKTKQDLVAAATGKELKVSLNQGWNLVFLKKGSQPSGSNWERVESLYSVHQYLLSLQIDSNWERIERYCSGVQ